LKATANVMPTLRVEELHKFFDTPLQAMIQRAPQATIRERVSVAERRLNLARPFKAGKVSVFRFVVA
jgi:hypothetical protein